MRSSKPGASFGSILVMLLLFLLTYFCLVGCRRQLDEWEAKPATIYIDNTTYVVSYYHISKGCIHMRLTKGGKVSKCDFKDINICPIKN